MRTISEGYGAMQKVFFFFFFFHINYYYHFYYLYKPFSALRQLFPLASRSRLTRDRALLLIDSGHVTMM